MQEENVKEYELIKKGITDIRDCITSYISFLIGGSGVAFFGITILSRRTDVVIPHLLQIGMPLMIAVLVTILQMILYYKFLSHNRLAGYGKLLIHERYEDVDTAKFKNVKNVILWEACMDMLIRSDNGKDDIAKRCNKNLKIGNLCKGLEDDEKKISELKSIIKDIVVRIPKKADRFKWFKKAPKIDRFKWVKGQVNFLAIFGIIRTDSWSFPAFVNAIFIILSPMFLAISGYFLKNHYPNEIYDIHFWFWPDNLEVGIIEFITIFLSYMWLILSGKLYTILQGSNTINNFCWKFLPIRAATLNDEGITPGYNFQWCPSHECNQEGSHQNKPLKFRVGPR